MKIHAPYNFVPLDKEVFFPDPDWANRISHDVPFSDGESGFISGKIKAETPIFISNGSAAEQDHEFSYYLDEQGNKKYFIPGTSLKGMLRNVVEIMSFAKMQFVDDRKFTWRELGDSDYTNKFSQGFNTEPLVKAGFIRKENNQWYLYPCKYARIEQSDLDQQIDSSKKIGYDNKLLSAVDKYQYWFDKGKKLKNKFSISQAGKNVFEKQFGKFRRARFGGNKKGQLIFTGQIGPKNSPEEGKHGQGKKHLEFVFYDESKEKILINRKMRRNFKLNHSKERNKAKHKEAFGPNEEWDFWRKRLNNNKRMPVFWLGNKNEIEGFGLAMLFRLPLKYSVHDIMKRNNKNHIEHIRNQNWLPQKFKPDLADCMFGYTAGEKALKGRVQCSHAECITPNPNSLKKQEVLSSPKPTFYPTYLKNGTYNDEHSKISGWKRYPIHQGVESPNYDDKKLKINLDNVGTKFQPLVAGTEFSFKIRYHNLRKVELGALLTALTFYGNEDKFYHSLGMAKPLGYGKISLKLNEIESTELALNEQKEYMDSFLSIVEDDLKINWKNSKQIKELLTMAHPQDNKANTMSDLSYLSLEHHTDIKKDKGKKLPYYSEIGNGVKPVSLQAKDDFLKVLQSNNLKEIFKKYKNDKHFMEAVEDYLEIEAYDPDNFTYYQKFFYNPKILLKCLKGKDVKGRELKSILKSVKNYDYNLEDETTRKIFDYILAVKYNNKIPRRFSKVEKQFKYSWFNLNPDENNVLDIIAKAEKGKIDLWPSLAELKDYIISKKMKEKKVLLDMLEAILEK